MIPAEAVNAAQLAYIALRAEREYKSPHEYAEAILEAAAPYMMAGVAALHYPQGDDYYKTCAHCIRPSGYPNRSEQPVAWPCPTAIASGLAINESTDG